MPKKYRVTLTGEERGELERLLSRGKADVRCLKHAQILLKADEADDGPGWSDERIAAAFHAGVATAAAPALRRGGTAGGAATLPHGDAHL